MNDTIISVVAPTFRLAKQAAKRLGPGYWPRPLSQAGVLGFAAGAPFVRVECEGIPYSPEQEFILNLIDTSYSLTVMRESEIFGLESDR